MRTNGEIEMKRNRRKQCVEHSTFYVKGRAGIIQPGGCFSIPSNI